MQRAWKWMNEKRIKSEKSRNLLFSLSLSFLFAICWAFGRMRTICANDDAIGLGDWLQCAVHGCRNYSIYNVCVWVVFLIILHFIEFIGPFWVFLCTFIWSIIKSKWFSFCVCVCACCTITSFSSLPPTHFIVPFFDIFFIALFFSISIVLYSATVCLFCVDQTILWFMAVSSCKWRHNLSAISYG